VGGHEPLTIDHRHAFLGELRKREEGTRGVEDLVDLRLDAVLSDHEEADLGACGVDRDDQIRRR